MLQFLTDYLLQYRTVSIPHVGTIKLVHQPAQQDVVNKCILPPSINAHLESGDAVPVHQLDYLTSAQKKTGEAVASELKAFGSQLLDAMNGPGFDWAGIGHFDRSTATVNIGVDGLLPVGAQKLLRENADHAVLVGDRETTSLQLADERKDAEQSGYTHDVWVIVGWVLLLLSILAMAYLLYSGKFNSGAAGSKMLVSGVAKSLSSVFA